MAAQHRPPATDASGKVAPNLLCPLGQEHCDLIDSTLQHIPAALELANKCISCGLPAESFVEQLTHHQGRLQRIRDTFFPRQE